MKTSPSSLRTINADPLPDPLRGPHPCSPSQRLLRLNEGHIWHRPSDLQTFHIYCQKKGINEAQRTPCGQTLLADFMSTLIGDYSTQAIESYARGLRAWHIIHRIPWKINHPEFKTLFASAEKKKQPHKPEKAQKPPCIIIKLVAIRDNLDLRDPFDAAVFSYLATTFWSVARLGEFTVPRLDSFDPERHVKRSDLNMNVTDRHCNRVTIIFVPGTEASVSRGEELN